jgi:hypothetical protein
MLVALYVSARIGSLDASLANLSLSVRPIFGSSWTFYITISREIRAYIPDGYHTFDASSYICDFERERQLP